MDQELLYVLRRLVEHSLPDGAEKHRLIAAVDYHIQELHKVAAEKEKSVEEPAETEKKGKK